jgi:hypothetical protein
MSAGRYLVYRRPVTAGYSMKYRGDSEGMRWRKRRLEMMQCVDHYAA